jgi:hypothetical protein
MVQLPRRHDAFGVILVRHGALAMACERQQDQEPSHNNKPLAFKARK